MPRRERLVACNRDVSDEAPRKRRHGAIPRETLHSRGPRPRLHRLRDAAATDKPSPIPCEELSHSRLVACSDPSGQRFVGRTFTSRCPLSRRGGPSSADANRSHWRLPLYPLLSGEIDSPHCPSLGCEVAAGVLGEVVAC